MTRYEYNITENGKMDYSKDSGIKEGTTIENTALALPRYSKLGSYKDGERISAYVSEQISNEEGVFEEYPILIASFERAKTCDGLELEFNSLSNDYPEEMKVEFYNKTKKVYVENVTPTGPTHTLFNKIEGFTSAVITFKKTNKPYRPIFISLFSFRSVSAYEGLRIVYNGTAPGADENMMISSDDAEPTLSWLPWIKTGEKYNYALELPNYAKLDGNTIDYNGGYMAGFLSDEISNENGTFTSNPKMEIVINDGYYTSTGINLVFDPNGREYCKEVKIEWYRDSEKLSEKTFAPNRNEFYCLNTVKEFNIVKIEFLKTFVGYRRAILSRVQIGHEVVYTQKEIKANNTILEISEISQELSTNTMSFTLQGISEAPIFQKDQKLEIYYDGIQQGAFYIKEGSQDSSITFTAKANDAMEMLAGDFYGIKVGNYYKASYDCTVEDFVSYVMEGTDVPYEIEDSVKALRVKGVLPIMTRREALQQMAFATGVIVDTFGDEKVKIVSPGGEKHTIDNDRIIELRVSSLTPCSKVEITAYSITQDEERNVLEEEIQGEKLLTFNDPVIITEWQNVSGVAPSDIINAISITGSGSVLIKGKDVRQSETVYKKVNNAYQESKKETEVKKVSGTYFVNADNVGTILDRVYGYYIKEKQITVNTFDMNIAPKDEVTVRLWDGTLYTGVVESVSSNYTYRVYSEVTLR